MFFKDIIGQKEVKEHLLKAVNHERIAHAILLNGPEGCGKMGLALSFARFILCTNRGISDGCGVCPSCVKVTKLGHPDLHFVFPIHAKGDTSNASCDDFYKEWIQYLGKSPYVSLKGWSNHLGLENQQPTIYASESSSIIRKLNLKPYESDYKVMIIYLPEKMNPTCANKLLKMLEEPPPKTVIILVSEDIQSLLTTIISRCQIVNIKPIKVDELTQSLSKFELSDAEKANVVRIANGNYVKAIQIIEEQKEAQANLDLFMQLMRLSYARNFIDLKKLSDTFHALGRERQKNVLQYCSNMIRENFILNIKINGISYLNSAEEDFSTKFSRFIDANRVYDMLSQLELAIMHIERNVSAKMVFFDLSYKLSQTLLKS